MSPSSPDRHHEDPRTGAGAFARRLVPVSARTGTDDDRIWAMVAYLGMIFFAFIPPLAVFLGKRRESPFVRYHAVQALNLWLTVFLYSLSFMIIGGLLALDTITAALSVGIPLFVGAGIALLGFAVRAALAASEGAMYKIPSWICATIIK